MTEIADNPVDIKLSVKRPLLSYDDTMPLKQLCLPGRNSTEKYPEYFKLSTPLVRLSDKKKYSGIYPDYQFLDQRLVEILEEEKLLSSQLAEAELLIADQPADSVFVEKLRGDINSGKFRLSSDRMIEKDSLKASSFISWERADFDAFVATSVQHGRSNKDIVIEETAQVTGKSNQEVTRYHDTFWSMYTEIFGYSDIIDKIDQTDKAVARKNQIKSAIETKISRHAGNLQKFSLSYGSSKGKLYTDEEDAFLVFMMHEHGYGNWEKIRLEVKNSWLFQFDWFFKSRTAAEIQRRCDILLRLIEKENGKVGDSSEL
jgi:SWI/SNF-related matrix-associated actin-dependent regulator of chromatin subfamily A member 5